MELREALETRKSFDVLLVELAKERVADAPKTGGLTFMGPSAACCALAPEKLQAYVDGTLSEDGIPEVMDAIIECEDCAQKLAEMMGERIGATAP